MQYQPLEPEYLKPYVSDDVEEEAYRVKTKRYFPDTYLDSPILTSKRSKWVSIDAMPPCDNPKTIFQRILRDVRSYNFDPDSYDIVDPDEYPAFYHTPWQSTLSAEFKDAFETAHKIYDVVCAAMKKHGGVTLPSIPTSLPREAYYWLDRWSYWDSLVEEFSRVNSAKGPNVIPLALSSHTMVYATKDVWWIKNDICGKKLLSIDQVLMVKDVCYSRAQCYIAASVLLPDNKELITSITDVCTWHEKCLQRYGNPGFEILKQTEALSKAYMSEMTDEIFGTDGPYGRMLDKVRVKERDLGATACLADEFDVALRKTTVIQTVVEMYGLLKISGHPLVDPELGGQLSATQAQNPSRVLYNDAQELAWEFKRCFLERYIHDKGWPALQFTAEGKRTRLRHLHNTQFKHLNRGSYPLSDWAHCRFPKIFDFDFAPNYLDLIDDKSISLYRTNVAATWDDDVPAKSHRRLLIQLINEEKIDVKAIVMMIMRREVPFDWFIVSVHPKEREFKLAPRMFSMLVMEMRMFFALVEANIADSVFPYLPQQTMTKSRLEISRMFLDITKPQTSSEALRMFYELDLSSWNLLWRAATVDPVSHTLNDMFGLPGVFDFAHEFFSGSMIMVRVGDLRPTDIHLPDPPNSTLVWRNHLGGFEGICQKLWTICTYSMISLAVQELPLSFILLGQADNQVMSIVTPRDHSKTTKERLTEVRDTVTDRLQDRCARTGQILKPEECLESTSVITYSKDVYVSGVYRPTALKFHSRLFPHSSEIFPSVRTNIGAIFSTAVAGSEKSTTPLSSYFLACLYAGLYLYRIAKNRGPFGKTFAQISRKLGNRFSEYVRFVLTLPSEAGGFPVIPFIGFTYKGGSDPLGKSLSAMTLLGMKSDDQLSNRMLAQMSADILYAPIPNLATLFMDPFSIPLKKPPTAIDGISSDTIEVLRGRIVTNDIKELVSADTMSYLDKLVECLSLCSPINPLIIRDILDCSIAGVTDTVSRMFVATRTLQVIVREYGVPVIEKVLHLEERGINYMYERFLLLPNDQAKVLTSFDLTTQCRNRWTPDTPGLVVGLTTHQPLDFSIVWGAEGLSRPGFNAVLIANTDPTETRGPYDPYVGSKTMEKRSPHGYKIVGTDSASRSMRKLQLIASQTGDDPIFKKIIDVVGWSRTNTTLSDVSHLLPGISGGTMSHRYAARAGHQDAFNIGSPNFATHCVVSSDNAGVLSGGMKDYPVMIQEQLLFALWTLMVAYVQDGHDFKALTLAVDTTTFVELPSVSVIGPNSINLPVIRYPHNPLAFYAQLRLEQVTGAVAHPALPQTETFTPGPVLRRHILEGYFHDILRKQGSGRSLGDGAYQHFQGAVMDIAEVYSNQLVHICAAIKNVVCDEVITNFMATDVQGRDRWRLEPFAYKLVSPLVGCISPLLGHPLLSKDPLVHQLKLYDNPTYSGGMGSSHRRLSSYVYGMILDTLRGYDMHYNHRSLGLFTSTLGRNTSEHFLACLLSDCYIWRVRHDIPSRDINSLLKLQVLPMIRKQHDEGERIDTIVRAASNLAQHYRLSHPDIYMVLSKYRHSRVLGYKATVADLLKSTRDIDAWGIPEKHKEPLTTPRPITNIPIARSIVNVVVPVPAINGCRLLSLTTDRIIDQLMAVYERNRSHFSFASGTAADLWYLFAGVLMRKPVILVGSGLGAVARVALEHGCSFVHGIDLRTTIPMKAHRFRSYKPPMVLDCEFADRYEQMPESFTTSGDWTDPEVSKRILAYDPGDSTIVLDIQSGEARYGLETLKPLIGHKTKGLVVVRLYATEHEADLLISDLTVSQAVFSWHDIESLTDIKPRVIIISQLPVVLRMTLLHEVASHITYLQLPTDYHAETARQDYALALSDSVFSLIYAPIGSSLVDMELILSIMIDETIGQYDSRLSYSDWTKLLQARLTLYWARQPRQRQRQLLRKWLTDKRANVEIGGSHEFIDVDYNLCRHLATYGARIIVSA